MRKFYFIVTVLVSISCQTVMAEKVFNFLEKFESSQVSINKVGRGFCEVKNGVIVTKDAYATFGKTEWSNYEIKFRARTPRSEEQVQIWSGFRTLNRNERYVVGLKGGLQNDLYFSRMGFMGTDEFLGMAVLDFHPETGTWYDFRFVVCGNRIQIFLNNELLPRIDVTDENGDLVPTGEVSLGGGWIETEYDDLSIKSIPSDFLTGKSNQEYKVLVGLQEKESKRNKERAAYKTIHVNSLSTSRTEISLDGQWLFMPTYELSNEKQAVSPNVEDKSWHTMSVPNFWNPIRIWLHGETMGKFPKVISDYFFKNESLCFLYY